MLALEHGEVEKFELGEVSLHDIFIAKVTEVGEVSSDEVIEGS